MPLNERITSVDKTRSWKDQIPFHYEYTAGVAGEKFLRGLQSGKLLASVCSSCRRNYLPPKAYCTTCFLAINKFREIRSRGTVSGTAESRVDFNGNRSTEPINFVFVTFEGVNGGMIHYGAKPGMKVGAKVRPKFRPASQRKGTILDIESFG